MVDAIVISNLLNPRDIHVLVVHIHLQEAKETYLW